MTGTLVTSSENQKLISTKELAEILNVDVSTVKKTVKRLEDGGEVLHHSTNVKGNVVFYYDENQVTLIKQEIQKHHNLQSRQIDNVSTQLEENQTIMNALQILQRRNNELTMRAEVAEKALNRIADSKGCFSMNATAKALKLPYGNIKLFEKLRGLGILNSDNTPKQEQINAGHFKVVIKHVNDFVGNKTVTITTGKGLVYLAKKFNSEIDTSVLPDA